MYNSESYRPTPKEEPSSSDPRTQGMNASGGTPNEGASSGVQQLLQLASDGIHDFGFTPGQGLQHPLAPLVNGAFQVQHPPLQGNPGSVYSGAPLASYEPSLNNTTITPGTPSSCQGCGSVPTNISHGGLPTAPPNLPSGQASNPGASFRVAGQPPAMTWLHNLHLPEVLASPGSPDEQGIPGRLWQLMDADLDYQGGEYLRVVILFRKIRPS